MKQSVEGMYPTRNHLSIAEKATIAISLGKYAFETEQQHDLELPPAIEPADSLIIDTDTQPLHTVDLLTVVSPATIPAFARELAVGVNYKIPRNSADLFNTVAATLEPMSDVAEVDAKAINYIIARGNLEETLAHKSDVADVPTHQRNVINDAQTLLTYYQANAEQTTIPFSLGDAYMLATAIDATQDTNPFGRDTVRIDTRALLESTANETSTFNELTSLAHAFDAASKADTSIIEAHKHNELKQGLATNALNRGRASITEQATLGIISADYTPLARTLLQDTRTEFSDRAAVTSMTFEEYNELVAELSQSLATLRVHKEKELRAQGRL